MGAVIEDEIELGFIEPGHGTKGRQQWLVDDDDLSDMYKSYEGKMDIMLWVYLGTRKTPCSPDPESASKVRKTKYDVHTHKMLEVEVIADDLETRHEGRYTREQYNVWAHMIHLKNTPLVMIHRTNLSLEDRSRSKKPSTSHMSLVTLPLALLLLPLKVPQLYLLVIHLANVYNYTPKACSS